MISRALLRASLLAIVTLPVAGCGGQTADTTGTTGTLGGSGGSSGGSGCEKGCPAGTVCATGECRTACDLVVQPCPGGQACVGSVCVGTGSAGGTGGSGSGGSSGKAGSGGSGGKSPGCEDPKAIVVDGKDTGYDTCAAGQIRRRQQITCPSVLPRDAACTAPDGTPECKTDSDCKGMPNGYCRPPQFEAPGCKCSYGCRTDSECAAGSICLCGDPVGTCVPATCTGKGSCPDGDCTSYDASLGCTFLHFGCQTTADTCGGDHDCLPPSYCSYMSSSTTTGPRACVPGGCAIGRPLVVGESLRIAGVASRDDWA